MGSVESLWEQVRSGRHVAAIGFVPFPLAGARGLSVARASGHGAGTLGVLHDAKLAVANLLGEPDGDAMPPRAQPSAASVLVDDASPTSPQVLLVDWCNRLVDAAGGRAALILDGVDDVDDDTARAIARLLRDRSLRLPVVLTWHEEPTTTSLEMLDAVRAGGGEDAVARAFDASPPTFAWSSLPPDVMEVLRCAAIVGSRFDAAVVAALLDIHPLRVITRIQQAVDLGAPIRDEGTGAFVLPRDAAQALRGGILPSLANALRAKLARILDAAIAPRGSPTVRHPITPPVPANASVAARHLADAGETVLAIERFLAAAAQLAEHGDCSQALLRANEAEALLERLPRSPSSELLRARIMLERARAEWASAGQDSKTLRGAFLSTEHAAEAMPRKATPALWTDLVSIRAAIAYELGELPLAGRVLDELRRVHAVASAAGDALLAARLSNDEAALRMRFAGAVGAAELLFRARDILMRVREDGDEQADEFDRQRALTEHLLARLPFHIEPGARNREAVVTGLHHAQAARTLYEKLDDQRGMARVTETMGRLETMLHAPDANRHLIEALEAQSAMGDAAGLARTTDALATLLAERGQTAQAMDLLESSAALNLRRGATNALEYNRRTLATIRAALPVRDEGGIAARVAQFEQALIGATAHSCPPPAPAVQTAPGTLVAPS